MVEIARWSSAFPEALGERRHAGLSPLHALGSWMHPFIALTLRLFYLAQKLKRKVPRNGRMEDFLRALYQYYPLLPGDRMIRPGPSLRRRVRHHYPAVVHPVRLVLYRDGVPYGIDEGVVAFENGRLVYEGDATAFALRPEDAALLPDAFIDSPKPDFFETEFRYGNLNGRRAWAFDLAAHPSVRVYLYAFRVSGTDSVTQPLFHWLMHPPEADGPTVLPPLEPQRGYVPPALT